MKNGATVDALRVLARLDRPVLAERWATTFGHPPPRHLQATMLRSALAWHYQMLQKAGPGKVSSALGRLRRSLASAPPAATLTPGTRLLREWQGQTHHVTVLAQGFEYGGKIYRSLTSITREITGTAWSGPLFFGLRS